MPKAKNKKQKPNNVDNNQDLELQLKRALADYQNLEKRIEEERKVLSKLSSTLLIEKLLPVLENTEKAQSHLKNEGLEMVIKQFNDILTQEGVEEIVAEGAPFDPNLHEAVETQEGEKENMVVKVVAKGYKIDSTVIRPAKVIVTKSSQQDNTVEDKDKDKDKEESYV